MIEIVNQKITNADRIRGMTDEELAAVLACPIDSGLAKIKCSWDDRWGNCHKCCLNWLQQEVVEKEIKVGDEITAVDDDGNKMSLFVQKITKGTRIKYWGVINYDNGIVDVGFISHGSDIKKTGRHIDIQSVLDKI